jgi:triacylglycerol lipase
VPIAPGRRPDATEDPVDANDLLDPEIARLLEGFPLVAVDAETLPLARAFDLGQPYEPSGAVTIEEHAVPPRDGSGPDVRVRVHRPVGIDGPLPAVYAIHGGGYVAGSFTADDPRFEIWCPEHRCVGVSVEYRLAPETPYPGPLEDCYAGLAWTVEHAASFGIDPDRIGVLGVSAGGGLAAGLALLVRDRGELSLAFQALGCPMIDDRQTTASSRLDNLAIWSRESNAFGWRSYLGDRYGTDDVPPYAAAARATDLAGLPPALVNVGGADGFRDEDITYAMRLSQAGVPTELHVYPGAPHGVQLFAATEQARRWNRHEGEWLARQLHPGA